MLGAAAQSGTSLVFVDRKRKTELGCPSQCGNCASASVLLVLENILRIGKPRKGDHGVLLTFGPGLTIEGAVLRF
jgi:predicted naringenin-chalcone synthase